jgi:environmental stress-induced protein Ves
MKIFRKAGYAKSAWKNGGGVTHEVLRAPAQGALFDWRMSVAQIDAPGPFSDFAGYSRIMVLLAGGGIVLRSAGVADLVLHRPGDLIRFDGAQPLYCDLVNGPCTDLNLMTSHELGPIEARIEYLSARPALRAMPDKLLIIFCVCGTAVLSTEQDQATELQTWDAAIIAPDDLSVSCSGPADPATPCRLFTAQIPAAPDGAQA